MKVKKFKCKMNNQKKYFPQITRLKVPDMCLNYHCFVDLFNDVLYGGLYSGFLEASLTHSWS
jgi:hypothetical protein